MNTHIPRGSLPLGKRPAAPSQPPGIHGNGPAHDVRWPALVRLLEDLHEEGRRSIRIVDADCGAGCLLVHAARHARRIGFTAIEGRGVDGVPQLVGRARAAAARLRDPAIGLDFDVADVRAALEQEADFPADIVLWRPPCGGEGHPMLEALQRSARFVLIDEPMDRSRGELRA